MSVEPVGEYNLVSLPAHDPCAMEAVEHIIVRDSPVQDHLPERREEVLIGVPLELR